MIIFKNYTLLKTPQRQDSGLLFVGFINNKIRRKGVEKDKDYLSRNHKQPNRIYSANGVSPAISASEGSGRYWTYIDNK